MSGLYEYWWSKGSEPHTSVFSTLEVLEDDQDWVKDANLRHMRLFGNSEAASLSSVGYSKLRNRDQRVTLNVIQSMCSTVTAKIAKNRPKATFLTSGGDWSMQKKAKLLDKFCEGQFYASGIYKVAPRVFLDACVFGTGIMKIYENDQEIKVERIFPNEVIVDDQEAVYGEPRQLFQTKYVSREVLIAAYPEQKAALLLAAPEDDDEKYSQSARTTDQIKCVEAWHLPSSKGGTDGRHIIAIAEATLLDEAYELDYFPFAFIKWTERLLGFWGQGLAEQLIGIQLEINKLLFNIQLQMHLAKPKVLIEHGSKIAKAHINNETWGVIEYSGTAPTFYVPKTVSGEIFSHLDRLFERAYEISGISQLAAQSKKPPGLESGVALREMTDIETERFMIVGQAYETLFLDAARQMVDLARSVDARGDTYEVVSHGDKSIERIKWSEIDLEESQYVMKVYPTSLLPTTPAAKLQTVQEMVQYQMLDKEQALSLLDYPDIESVNSLMTADVDDIMMLIDEMLDKGRPQRPEPFSNLPLAIKMVQSAYLRAKIDGAPERNLDLLRRYIEEAAALIAPPPQQMMEGVPGAVPPVDVMEGGVPEPTLGPIPEMGPEGAAPGMGGMGGPDILPAGAGLPPMA